MAGRPRGRVPPPLARRAGLEHRVQTRGPLLAQHQRRRLRRHVPPPTKTWSCKIERGRTRDDAEKCLEELRRQSSDGSLTLAVTMWVAIGTVASHPDFLGPAQPQQCAIWRGTQDRAAVVLLCVWPGQAAKRPIHSDRVRCGLRVVIPPPTPFAARCRWLPPIAAPCRWMPRSERGVGGVCDFRRPFRREAFALVGEGVGDRGVSFANGSANGGCRQRLVGSLLVAVAR